MSQRLQDRVAIVTGAGTIAEGMGNGKATALLFAREGARIAAVDLNRDAAEATAEEIRREGGDAIALAGDSRSADVRAIVDAAIERFGRIDVLHNNVGIERTGDPVSTTETAERRVTVGFPVMSCNIWRRPDYKDGATPVTPTRVLLAVLIRGGVRR